MRLLRRMVVVNSFEKRRQRFRRQLGFVAALFVGVLTTGILGYHWIEGWSLFDATYMTVITLFGVGYAETHPLSQRGRIFTIVLILLGLVTIAYVINRFTEAVTQGYFQERAEYIRQKRLINKLHDHYIVCGFSRTGRQVAAEFAEENVPFIVIDLKPEAAQQAGYLTYQGDATLDETLLHVGIERAACLVTAMPSDAENLYVILSARSLNPEIRTIARANTAEAVQKLQRAGAASVISPYITGGKRMAAAALRPQVLDFVDGILTGGDRSFYMEELRLDPDRCPLIGQSLRDANLRDKSGALILAIRRAIGDELMVGPMGETLLMANDLLICMGTSDQLKRLNALLDKPS
jgi:voltage-gated potassium channel